MTPPQQDVEPRSIEAEAIDEEDDTAEDDDVRRVDLGEVTYDEYRLLVGAVGAFAAKGLLASNGDTSSKAFADYETLTEFSLGLLTADRSWGRRLTCDEDSMVEANLPPEVIDELGIERTGSDGFRRAMNDAVSIDVGGSDE